MKIERYRIRKASSLEELQRQVRQVLPVGFIPVGDIGHWYDEKKDKHLYWQATIKEAKY